MTAWMSWGYDASRLPALTATLTETGGGGATGAISLTAQYAHWIYSGTYQREDPLTSVSSTPDTGYVNFGEALETALNAVGNATYVVTFDPTSPTYNITASGGGVTAFALTSVSNGLSNMLGLYATSLSSTALSWTTLTSPPAGQRIWHWTIADNGGWSEWQDSEQDIDGEDLRGADGSTRGLVAIDTTRALDFVAPLEPLIKIQRDSSQSDTYCTWHHMFRRCRTVEPVWFTDARSGVAGFPLVGYLRQDACVLRPRLMAADYLAYQSVPFGFYVLGTGAWFDQV